MDNAIKLRNVKKVFRHFKKDYMIIKWLFTRKGFDKEFNVLNGISLDIKKGEIVGILGKNGAGKSTLLKIISGIYFPSSGNVDVNGTIASLIELGAGFRRELTGRENVYFKGTLHGLSREYIDDKIDEIIEFADIGEYIDMALGTYSSGMGARLGFSLAVNSDPDILIIDEVFSVGDKNFQQKSRKKTEELLNSGKTVLFVSHSEGLIKEFCNRVLYLKNGKIVYNGEVEKGIALYHADNLNIPREPMVSYIDAEFDGNQNIKIQVEYGMGSTNVVLDQLPLDQFEFFGTIFEEEPVEDMFDIEVEDFGGNVAELTIPIVNLEYGKECYLWYKAKDKMKRIVITRNIEDKKEEGRIIKIRARSNMLSYYLDEYDENDGKIRTE